MRLLTALAACALVGVAGCGGGSTSTPHTGAAATTPSVATTATASTSSTVTSSASSPPPPPKPAPPPYPRLLASATSSGPTPFVPVVQWNGQTAAWIARSGSGVGLLSFNQRLVQLRLHSGTVDAGGSGWRFGPAIAGLERRFLVAAFNGAFKFSTGAGGFMSFGSTGAPLRDGLASIVTYTDGYTDIGSWHQQLPASSHPVASVRQNLTLLIDHGRPAATVDCVSCWGATLGGVSDPARSAIGITGDGHIVWAGGEHLTPSQLTDALLGARVARAVELDINPEWVNGYLYGHRGGVGPLAPVPVVPGETGIPGQFLAPWSRDFFTVVAR
jgi:hypothetical protein